MLLELINILLFETARRVPQISYTLLPTTSNIQYPRKQYNHASVQGTHPTQKRSIRMPYHDRGTHRQHNTHEESRSSQ